MEPTTSKVITRASDKVLRQIYLIGNVTHQISGAKLPSNRQVLQVYFYNIRFAKLSQKESARLAVNAASLFWLQARLPIRDLYKCADKLIKLYNEWRRVSKKSSKGKANKDQAEFLENLDNLFDIAHNNALQMIRIEDDREFLLKQRQKGRPGCMIGVDMHLFSREKRSQERRSREESRKRKHDESQNVDIAIEENNSASESDNISDDNDPTMDVDDYDTQPEERRGRTQLITPRLSAALDDAKVSDRKAIHIIMAVAEALRVNVDEHVVNRTSLQNLRRKHREKEFEKIQAEFVEDINSAQSLVVHWDGKLMEAIVGKKKVERIAILVSYKGTAKFLSAAIVEPATGENIAGAVRNALISWNIIDRVGAMSFDTTSSNTGPNNGAIAFLQQYLDRKLIKLPCRHHIFEIVLKSVFDLKYSATSAPEVPIFNRFAEAWDNLNHTSFKCGLDDEIVRSKISEEDCDEVKHVCYQNLQKDQIRADYKEFLQLTVTFLGGNGGNFRTCSSTSHARFMGKAIYCLKIFLFREQFKCTDRQLSALRDVCIFLVRLYVKVWYGCPNAITAPNQDLQFVKDSIAYAETDAAVSNIVLSKIKNHLWYLAPENVALAFFDPSVSDEAKRKMIKCLQSSEPNVNLLENRRIANVEVLRSSSLSDLVSYKTKYFFTAFGLSACFLEKDPSLWEEDDDYQDALEFCRNLFVVNDAAERGVKFMKDYNRILTNDENQKQLVFQFVESYRQKFPSHKKSTLT